MIHPSPRIRVILNVEGTPVAPPYDAAQTSDNNLIFYLLKDDHEDEGCKVSSGMCGRTMIAGSLVFWKQVLWPRLYKSWASHVLLQQKVR